MPEFDFFPGARAEPVASPLPPGGLCELHLHLEGALSVARARALWREFPEVGPPPPGALGEDGWEFGDLGGFLRAFGWSTRLLAVPGAYRQLLGDLARQLQEQGVSRAELFVAFGQMHQADLDPRKIVPELAEQAAGIEAAGGPRLHFLADATRQWGVTAAERVLDDALALQDHRVVGFGIGGDESALRAREFRGLYRRARAAGLGTSIHAGEGTHPDAVREAVEELGVPRVGHGIAAARDPQLLRELAEEAVVLELCPTSNEVTGAWDPASGEHPVLRLLAAGVPVVLGSDDPAFFGCDLPGERERLRGWGVDEETLALIDARAFEVAFAAG